MYIKDGSYRNKIGIVKKVENSQVKHSGLSLLIMLLM
ncbi:hypothetical protein ACRS6Y_10680 [Bacillus cytotoxicus]